MAAKATWTDSRLSSQRPSARALNIPTGAGLGYIGGTLDTSTVRSRDLAVPSWVVFCMIIFATFAVCVTVTMRTHAAKVATEQKLSEISSDVHRIRATNDALRHEVDKLGNDPRTIEAAARSRMNMVRSNEIIIPLE